MIVDDVEGFLKFLDKVSYQLTCLLDIDGREGEAKRNHAKPKGLSLGKSRPARVKAANAAGRNQHNKVRTHSARKRHKSNKLDSTPEASRESDPTATNEHQMITINDLQQQQQQSRHLDTTVPTTGLNERHPSLETQLTLNIADELPLDHVTSISPETHLSPIDPSLQFGTIQQHYYTHQRDSYHLHDEFSSHDPIPISASSTHIGGQQVTTHQHEHQGIMMSHQPPPSQHPNIIRAIGESIGTTTDCCSQMNHHQRQDHHHLQQHQQQQQQQHQHHQNHQHHQHHNQHHVQYQQLDQQWLCPPIHSNDVLQMNTGVGDPVSSLDHEVNLSPVTHQSLEHVQFSTPLYHHSYYNQQTDHIDSFQHLSDDYATSNSASLGGGSTSAPINSHLQHRMPTQQEQDQHHSQQHPQSHNNQQMRMPIEVNDNHSTNYDQQQQIHNNHQLHVQHTQITDNSQMQVLIAPYSDHSQHHHSTNNNSLGHHTHQMIHGLMNGIEPGGVIIQDINLASASWSSPEDLYSI